MLRSPLSLLSLPLVATADDPLPEGIEMQLGKSTFSVSSESAGGRGRRR